VSWCQSSERVNDFETTDFIEFFAEIDLLAVLSACPGGDCSAEAGDRGISPPASLLDPYRRVRRDNQYSSRTLPPKAAAAIATKAPINNDSAPKIAKVAVDLRAASAA
jgi:uncharacterized protein YcgI (DUF1989 family)